ncbi:uncharacterized protein LOC125316483 [Rhodamnia argentea]|uniref:Uncharacterized protein LOC125316483 n=1 Tax=Rhodamnia argentea TaxID=178133 RepID=A0ABM3HW11_9MYRT|nr:uncharacterized protein LOC125316483 [Rhodamnia argentea]
MQNAFVKGRRIGDNILLAQELFSGFHHDPYLPKCAIKVDFRKAYDTVDWEFLRLVLHAFGFPVGFINLIMTCVTTPKFSISINGELHGFFASGRGLRQGDPMSAYLFTLVMEIFTGIINLQTRQPDFKFYWRCKATRLSHLFFADDVLIFTEANSNSVALIKAGLDRFSNWSGLRPNMSKSELFCSGGSPQLRHHLLSPMGFREGVLPIRYLGVPLISSRLSKGDCISLVNIITARARSWTQRFLSFAGRLLLVKTILHATQVFWASVFILPKSVLLRIEQILRQFLRKGPDLGTGGVKVSWDKACLPKEEGGLGIRRLSDCNKAAMLKHIWILFTDKESIWCKWIHSNFLKYKSFWVATRPTLCSWSWKKILDLRKDSEHLFRWRVGSGNISFWFDSWHTKGPLYKLFSDLDIYRSGISRKATVRDFLTTTHFPSRVNTVMGAWSDPMPSITPESQQDTLIRLGHSSGVFSSASAWDLFRRKGQVVQWHSFIWDRHLAPRYSFILWLITLNGLPTQVILLAYHRIAEGLCGFCNYRPDSIDHLFFGCSITNALALFWSAKCNFAWHNASWQDNLRWVMKHFRGHLFYQCIARFSFGALCHVMRTERNHILFRNKQLNLTAIKECLQKVVKDKATTFRRVDDIPVNRRIQISWGISSAIFD